MDNNIDMMVQFLEKNNIPILEGTIKKDGGSDSDNKEKFHALFVGSLRSSSFIIDSGSSKKMASMEASFSAMFPYDGTYICMGDDSEIQAKGIDMIDLEYGYFNNVLFVTSLATNLLSVYQMTHTGRTKRIKFTQNDVEISKISIGQVVVVGFVDHGFENV